MVLIVVGIRDTAVDAFMRPWFVPSTGMAIRSFQDEVRNAESPMAKHPADYTLFQLGSFDEDSGKFENLDSPRQLVRGLDVAKED